MEEQLKIAGYNNFMQKRSYIALQLDADPLNLIVVGFA